MDLLKGIEDNNRALTLAKVRWHLTPHSNHIAVKYTSFANSHVTNDDWQILLIDTLVQKANLFTKGLPVQKDAFERLWNHLSFSVPSNERESL